MTTGTGYFEFLQLIGEVISVQPLYNQSFDYLIYEFLKGNGKTYKDLAEALNVDSKTLYRYRYNETIDREKVINICIALGLDLVNTFIVLMSKGFILNPYISIDKEIMKFIDNNNEIGLKRLLNYRDIINKVVSSEAHS